VRTSLLVLGLAASLALAAMPGRAAAVAADVRCQVTLPDSAGAPVTGRIFLVVTRLVAGEPRLVRFGADSSYFGIDVRQWPAGGQAQFDAGAAGYPLRHLGDLPPGDYRIQAVLNIYTEFHRADGHVIWAHRDQWEGQKWAISPGNRVSEPQPWHWDGRTPAPALALTRVIPPIVVPPDTRWVKRIKIESPRLSRFWGQPMYLGATILLPKGYDEHPGVRYPVIYLQGHFNLGAPFGFTTEPDLPGAKSWARLKEEWAAGHLNMPEPPPNNPSNGALANVESGYEFSQSWRSDGFPRMIAVSFQHPTPYFDDSYAINSANAGPYGDAIMEELIPAVEEHFRVIRQSYARVLAGGSTGGFGSLALQVYHPVFFGGAWCFAPDPVDLRRYYGAVDLYADDNAFTGYTGRFVYPVRNGGPGNRLTSQETAVLGAEDGGLAWSNLGPVGADGYPRPFWNLTTGRIDREVVAFLKAHNLDMRDYLQRNWPRLGPKLVGKLHFYCGDDDTYYLNLAVYLMEDFLENTHDPYYAGSFTYGRPLKTHGWQPMTNADLVRIMAKHIDRYSPASEQPAPWLLP